MRCWSCKKDVPVKKTNGGRISANCNWCDFPHYAIPGTLHFKNMMRDVQLDAPPANDAPAPEPALEPAAPAPAKRYAHQR